MRCKKGRIDYNFICAYVPPKPSAAAAKNVWVKTVTATYEWIHEQVVATPHRCTPILGLDNNDRQGFNKWLKEMQH